MNTRQRIALAWPPLLLRLGLALTFLWTGWVKVFTDVSVDPAQAAALANIGIITPGNSPGGGVPPVLPAPGKEKPPTPAGPDRPLPPAEGTPEASNRPAGKSNGRKAPSKPARTAQASAEGSLLLGAAPPVAAQPQSTPSTPTPAAQYTPDQFPEQTQVRAVYRLSLLLVSAATPKGDGGKTMTLWPAALAGGKWPIWLAWAVALTEFAGGLLVLAGFMTRLSALGLAGVMAGAIWLTQIGPAIQSGKTMLGFLPAHALTDIPAWTPLHWQMALLVMSLALFFAGPGAAALDNVIFSAGPAKKPAPPAAKPA
jgi:uncharacterized membrane protein YphA (DoxX/SURF4 family)